jgi:vacuolar protein sorting-associated protein 13A/C
MWGSQPTHQEEAEDDTVMTEEQKKELYDAIDWDERKALEESIDVPRDTVKALIEASLKTGSFTLRRDPHGACNDILSILFDNFTSKVAKRPDSFLAEISLGALRVYDGTTEGTLFPQIVKIKKPQDTMKPVRIEEVDEVDEFEDIKEESADGDEPFFQASFEQNPLDGSADSAVTVKMRSMEIIYNPSFVEGAYRFFKPPERHMESINALIESASATVENIRQQTRAGLEFALEEHKTINAKLDLQAPLIIIPESCTKTITNCLVLDAGHISMSSELISKDDIKEIQSKQSKTYTDEDYEQLENLMYDKFKLQLQSTQVLIGPSIEETLKQLESTDDDKHLHIVDRINIDFLVQVSILPKAPNLTKFKISGHLPMLQASISDLKYKTLMRLIDVAIPNFDDEEEEVAASIKEVVHRPHPLIRGDTGTSNHEDLIIDDESDAETEVGDGQKSKSVKPSSLVMNCNTNPIKDKAEPDTTHF